MNEMSVDECIFCQIGSGVASADVVFEDEESIFFRDISPQAEVHIVGIPKKHIISLASLTEEDQAMIGRLVHSISNVASEAGIAEGGYRVITNVGMDAGQEVKHLHWHILGGEPLGPLRCK